MTLNETVKHLREEHLLDPEAIADILNITECKVHNILNNQPKTKPKYPNRIWRRGYSGELIQIFQPKAAVWKNKNL